MSPSSVHAADSASFTLYDDVSDVVDGSPLGSNSFSLNEAGETWIAYPLTGGNFQIVTAPPAQSSSVESSSSSSVSSSEQSGGGGSGGHRGSGTQTQNPSAAGSSSPTIPTKPSASDTSESSTASDPVIPDIPYNGSVVDPLPDVEFIKGFPTDVPVYATDDTRHERITYRSHFFDMTERETDECICQQMQAAAPSVPIIQTPIGISFLLLLSFVLGYVARLARPGFSVFPQKKSTQKKK